MPDNWLIYAAIAVAALFVLKIVTPADVVGWFKKLGGGLVEPNEDVDISDFKAYQQLKSRAAGRSAEAAAAVDGLLVPLFGGKATIATTVRETV